MARRERLFSVPSTGPGPSSGPDELLDELWERGGQPDVRAFLAPWLDHGLPLADLPAVLRVDQRRRWLAGQRVDIASYQREFAALRDDPEAFFELVYSELLIRDELGERPDPDEYAALYPDLADRLRLQLEVHHAFSSDDLSRTTGSSPGGAQAADAWLVPGYELLDEIGRGGMGIVYRARQLKPRRLVALKMILDGRFASEHDLLRFQNETEVVAALEHPSIVPILEAGQHDGLHYFSMPLLTGGSLAELQPLPCSDPQAVVRLVAEVAAAVHHAHERGILHRDLKPANILLDDEGRPHVTDFGLAKQVRNGAGLTETGAILGSPGYMSPEQASGNPSSVTTASDIYGLGAILYALLTGQAPFEGSSVRETIARLNEQPPEPPSRINRSVPRPLDQICLMCLEKDPARRYPTARALAADLKRWLAGEPVLAQPEPLTDRTMRWMRRQRTAVTAAAVAILVALVGIAAVLAVLARANRDLTASNDRERARFDLAMEAIKSFHTGVSEELLLKEPQFQSLRTKLLHEAREFFGKLETLLKDQQDRRSRQRLAQAYEDLAGLTDKIGSKTEALDLYGRGLALRRQLAREVPVDLLAKAAAGRCLIAVGTLQYQTGHAELAMAAYQEARDHLKAVCHAAASDCDVRSDLAKCEHLVGNLLAATGRPEEAMLWYRTAQTLREALNRDFPRIAGFRSALAESAVSMGNLEWKRGKPAEAVALFDQARCIFESLAHEYPSAVEFRRQVADCYNAISYPLHTLGRTVEAEKSFQAAHAILERLVKDYPAVTAFRQQLAYSDTQIGTLLWDTGRPVQALAPYERARASLEALAQANPTVAEIRNDLARCYSQMGHVLRAIGKPALALASSEEARRLRESLIEANPSVTEYRSDLAVTLGVLGSLRRAAGQSSEAAASFRRAIIVLEGLPSRTPDDFYNLACYHASLAGLAGEAGSGITASDSQTEYAQAMTNLRQAATAGFRMLSLMIFDHDLDALRSREEFKLLLMDLSFPDDPFSP